MKTIKNIIRERIEAEKNGYCFSRSDFADLGSRMAVSQSLSRLKRDLPLSTPLRGYYCRPVMSTLLNEPMPPDYGQLAQAIARNYGWTILPCGDVALNELGLSTQVPAVWAYASTGPYRNYTVGNVKIVFNRVAGKDIFNISTKSASVVQALKALGRKSVTDSVIQKLRDRLTATERRNLAQETVRTTSWIFEVAKKIATEPDHELSRQP